MIPATGHRLWPVLTVLVGLVAGAGAVEVFAARRQAPEVTIHVEARAFGTAADGDMVGAAESSDVMDAIAAVDAKHERARSLARRGELDAALRLFAQVAADHPERPDLRVDYAFWLIRAGKERDAITELERARATRSDDPYGAYVMAIAYRHLDETHLAIRWYREALKLAPQLSSARIGLASLLLQRHRLDEAREIVAPATQSGSNHDRARANCVLGQALIALGAREEARHAFVDAIERAPAQPEIRIDIARALAESGSREDVARALEMLEEAVTIAPDLASVHTAMGRVLEKLGDREGAERAYHKALSVDPSYRTARRRMLRLALRLGDYAHAGRQADYLLDEDPDEPEFHFLAALVASRRGSLDEARAHYRDAIALEDGNYPEAWFNLGLLERGAGHLDDALAAYEQAVDLDPRYRTAWNNMGLVLASQGRTDEAERAYRRALELYADYGPALVNLAMLLSSVGRHDEAVSLLSRAIEARHGDYRQARLNLGVVQTRAGHPDEAIAIYRSLTHDEPRYALAYHNLGEVYEALGRAADALAAYRRALELDPERNGSRARVAALLAARGDRESALHAYEDLLDRDPHHAEARRGLASLYLELGDRTRCRRNARMAVADEPTDEVARQLLSRCAQGGG